MSHEVTLEQVEQEIEALEAKHLHKVDALHAGKAANKTFDPATVLTALCGAVTIAMPFLKIIKSLPFIGKKLKAAIQRIIDTALLVCPED